MLLHCTVRDFAQAVAPLGTAITEQQIELLWRMVSEPIICLDGDAAGQKAAAKVAERVLPLLKPGYSLRFAVIPPPEDPDSLIRLHGADAMAGILACAEPLSNVLWKVLTNGQPLNTPERRAAVETEVIAQIGRIADITVQQQYRADFRPRLWSLFPSAGCRVPLAERMIYGREE